MPAFYGKGRWHDIPFFVMQFADAVPENQSRPRTRQGVYDYRRCNFEKAFRELDSVLQSEYYTPSDFKRINVRGMRDDSLRRMREAGWQE